MAFSSLAPASAKVLIKAFKPSDSKAWFTKYHIYHLAMCNEAVMTNYFGYLLATAKIREIDAFLKDYKYDKDYLLNTKNVMFQYGTALHAALYWHNGAHGLALFNLLIKYGARIYKTESGLPWEQQSKQWIQPVDGELLGERNPDDFTETYEEIKDVVEKLHLKTYSWTSFKTPVHD
jgi:hypothetical protein